MAKQPTMEELMGQPQAAQLLKNPGAVEQLTQAPETKKLMQMLNQGAGGDLQSVTEAAMKGDTSQLMALMNQVLSNPEGAKMVDQLQRTIQGKE